ncbi:uncharacterized protein LOC111322485 isoform X2 [Stylophora pistillata]|uniref:Uncharacterized protein n=2 Tax=Stylophora pistillata TaxID=50429 RepID=A0A2B4SKS6_STYPI|nr:uncharacterized protein LOC111322485 isoform X2 [Stylophora pistillata]PFX31284.1 hypothetical protein AWC38_SpisGene3907 [Stylophora pistillata]
MELTLWANITLPVDTVSVGNIMVFVYDANGLGGRLISRLANTSGISQASPDAQMIHELRLEKANITLTSKVTKNPTTNQSQVGSEFKIHLTGSTLYQHFFVIQKVLFVVTSYSKLGEADDHQNDQLFLMFYTKSGVTSQDNETTNKPIATEATTPVLPLASTNMSVQDTIKKIYSTTMEVVPSVILRTVSASAQTTVTSPISVIPTFVSLNMSPRVCKTVSPSNTVWSTFNIASASDQNTVGPPTTTGTDSSSNRAVAIGVSFAVLVIIVIIAVMVWYCFCRNWDCATGHAELSASTDNILKEIPKFNDEQ